MTNEELIKKLQNHDPNASVVVAIRCKDDFWEVEDIDITEDGDIELIF